MHQTRIQLCFRLTFCWASRKVTNKTCNVHSSFKIRGKITAFPNKNCLWQSNPRLLCPNAITKTSALSNENFFSVQEYFNLDMKAAWIALIPNFLGFLAICVSGEMLWAASHTKGYRIWCLQICWKVSFICMSPRHWTGKQMGMWFLHFSKVPFTQFHHVYTDMNLDFVLEISRSGLWIFWSFTSQREPTFWSCDLLCSHSIVPQFAPDLFHQANLPASSWQSPTELLFHGWMLQLKVAGREPKDGKIMTGTIHILDASAHNLPCTYHIK